MLITMQRVFIFLMLAAITPLSGMDRAFNPQKFLDNIATLPPEISCMITPQLPCIIDVYRWLLSKILTPILSTILHGHTDFVWSVCCSADGKYIVAGSSDTTITIFNLDIMKTMFHVVKNHCLVEHILLLEQDF